MVNQGKDIASAVYEERKRTIYGSVGQKIANFLSAPDKIFPRIKYFVTNPPCSSVYDLFIIIYFLNDSVSAVCAVIHRLRGGRIMFLSFDKFLVNLDKANQVVMKSMLNRVGILE